MFNITSNAMRHLLLSLLYILLFSQSAISQTDVTTQPDPTVDVVGYFAKNDTLVYWINQSRWQLSPTDTVKIAGASTKVMLTVADSTATGYKIDYTVLDVRADSIFDSEVASLLSRMTTEIAHQIVGTKISFETDDLGAITHFNNLDQIKQQAESMLKAAINSMIQTDALSKLAEPGIDLSKISEMIDTDRLIEGYLEEIRLIFLLHGLSFKEGQTQSHEDATDTAYENDTYTTATTDPEDDTYSVAIDIVNIIPPAELKSLVGQLIDITTDTSLSESLNEAFDSQKVENCDYSSYFCSDYLSCGWPYRVINQTTVTVNNQGKSTQTYIYLDSIN
ncbi:MAG: hypothetical protein HDS53_01275 [Barnesiella sp.]|nr:hypothetical protein [Barnesiella sp.]